MDHNGDLLSYCFNWSGVVQERLQSGASIGLHYFFSRCRVALLPTLSAARNGDRPHLCSSQSLSVRPLGRTPYDLQFDCHISCMLRLWCSVHGRCCQWSLFSTSINRRNGSLLLIFDVPQQSLGLFWSGQFRQIFCRTMPDCLGRLHILPRSGRLQHSCDNYAATADKCQLDSGSGSHSIVCNRLFRLG